jgi:hypothetical protein
MADPVGQLRSAEFMAACEDDVFKISSYRVRATPTVRRGQLLREPLEIANEVPADDGREARHA